MCRLLYLLFLIFGFDVDYACEWWCGCLSFCVFGLYGLLFWRLGVWLVFRFAMFVVIVWLFLFGGFCSLGELVNYLCWCWLVDLLLWCLVYWFWLWFVVFAGVWYCGLGFMGSFGDFGFRLVLVRFVVFGDLGFWVLCSFVLKWLFVFQGLLF